MHTCGEFAQPTHSTTKYRLHSDSTKLKCSVGLIRLVCAYMHESSSFLTACMHACTCRLKSEERRKFRVLAEQRFPWGAS